MSRNDDDKKLRVARRATQIRQRKMKSVLIIEVQMKQYRLPFYERLYERLRTEDIQLKVAYSDPAGQELQKRDNSDLPLEYGLKVKSSSLLKKRILYQPLLHEISSADLVISDHAYKLALTPYLLLLSRLRLKRVAFWGHGENRQGNASPLLEQCRKWTLDWVTWWFAYTTVTAEYLQHEGVPKSKITTVQNSVDTRRIQEYVQSLDVNAKALIRARLEIPAVAPVGIFVGRLQKVKSVPLLLEASRAIRKSVNEFHLIIVGGGPEEEEIRESAREQPWVHFLGPKFEDEKSELLAIADVFLLPGAVGLAILDAFAAGLPLVTTQLLLHGPEIEYLEEGRNGVITPHDPSRFAEAVARLFTHPAELRALREGAGSSAKKYSIENMVENFSRGIVQCLSNPKRQLVLPSGTEKKVSHVGLQQENQQETWSWRTRASGKKPDARLTSQLPAWMPISQAKRRSLMTTSWDDGHPLDFRVAELLEKYGLAGTFYVPRTSQRAVMHPQKVRELGHTFEIGAHTLEHVRIDRLADEEASEQLSGSRRWVEEITGKSCEVFCFPGGKFKTRQLSLVRKSGFRAARTVELLSIAEPRCVSGLWMIPTTVQAFPHGPLIYAMNTAKRPSASHILSLSAALDSKDWVTIAKELLARTVQSGGVFHLWGHSWEIEEEGQWDNLDLLLKTMSEWRQEFLTVTNSELCEHAA